MLKQRFLSGYPFCINGRIIKGQQLGRQLGFATANINLKPKRTLAQAQLLARGVFAVRAQVHNRSSSVTGRLQGIANLGYRPTVNSTEQPSQLNLEVHLFDFEDNIYAQHLSCEFVHPIRAEQRFNDIQQLRQQIAVDCQQAKALLQSYP